jgi:phenylpropionate dioxygenase-like ring-hydroxylating dioxygenase large terminal subunit
MYINFWYPVARCDEITNEAPFRTRILSLDFVAFRDSGGQAHVLSDTCIHRGAALGTGKIKGDCVECPYHGWQYNGTGACTLVPSLGKDQKPPARAKVDSYPIQERYGIVFAFLGDLPEGERPPLYDIEEYEQEDWRANKLVVFEVDYYFERSVENGLDPAHNEFVHPKQGAPGMVQDFINSPIPVEDIGDWGSKFIIPFIQIKKQQGLMKEEAVRDPEDLEGGSGHLGPNQLITWLHFSKENMFHQYFFEAPIDENRTRIFFVNMRHFMMEPENDQRIVDINMEIAQEDIDLLEKLNPVRTPESTTKEVLVPADLPVVRYREYLKDWEGRGWRIDMQRMAELRGDVAVAIPCPGRRLSGNWVLDEVPMIQ